MPPTINVDSLKGVHPSRPRNLLIADVCFKGGYIDAWGSGTLKIVSACKEAGLPEPEIIEQGGGIMVTLYKDRYNEKQLQSLGLNGRQVKAVLYVIEKGRITNGEYQKLQLPEIWQDLLRNTKFLKGLGNRRRDKLCLDWLIIGSIGYVRKLSLQILKEVTFNSLAVAITTPSQSIKSPLSKPMLKTMHTGGHYNLGEFLVWITEASVF